MTRRRFLQVLVALPILACSKAIPTQAEPVKAEPKRQVYQPTGAMSGRWSYLQSVEHPLFGTVYFAESK